MKVEVVVGSDLIIYAAGSRDLPLRFTAFRKQEQIEGSISNPLNEHASMRALRSVVVQIVSFCTLTLKNPIFLNS